MAKFRLQIEATVDTDADISDDKLIRIAKDNWHLDAGPGVMFGDDRQVVYVTYGEFNVTVTGVKE